MPRLRLPVRRGLAAAVTLYTVTAAAADAERPAGPSPIERSGVEAFALYSIGNVRGLDASRVVGNYRWNGLPVLNQSRGAYESAQRYDIQTGLRALETGFVYPGGVVDLVTKDAAVVDNGAVAAWSSHSLRYAAADVGTGSVRLNVAGEDGGLAISGLRYRRAYAAAAAKAQLALGTQIEGSFEYTRFRERGEQASLFTDGLAVPKAPAAETLLGQTWAGTEGTERVASLRLRQRLGAGWEATFGVLRLEERFDDHDFYGQLAPAARYELNYAHDPSQRFIADTLHAEVRGDVGTGALRHRLTFGATGMRSRSRIEGAISVLLGTSSLHAPQSYERVSIGSVNAPYEAQRADDDGWFVTDRVRVADSLEMTAGYKGGRYRQRGANVAQPANERYGLKSAGIVYAPRGFDAGRTTMYASYGEALEQGVTAPLGTTNAERVLPSFVTRQIEAGVRFTPLQRLELEVAAFRARRSYEYPDRSGAFVQNGQLVHEGIELKAVGEVSRDLTIFAALLFLRPRVQDVSDPAVSGRQAIGIPTRSLRLIAEYRITAVPGLSLNASLEAVGQSPADAYEATWIPGYGVLSLGAQIERKWIGERSVLRFDLYNVADRAYWASVTGGYLTLGEPRSAHVRLAVGW